jgi:hypothetical protein
MPRRRGIAAELADLGWVTGADSRAPAEVNGLGYKNALPGNLP